MQDRRRILCLNSGSSSLKFAVYELRERHEELALEGAIEGIGLASGRLWQRTPEGPDERGAAGVFADHDAALRALLATLEAGPVPPPDAAGHRIVHGGPERAAPERVDAALLAALRRCVPLAPLHLPGALRAIEALAALRPALPQVACFDTAFHRPLPEIASRLPLPRPLWDAGLRRYGFHGLSYESVVEQLGADLGARTVIAHLGNGSSLVALRDGRPLDTTMGLTPLGGVMMGTRSGDLDPGVLLWLLNEGGHDVASLERLLAYESGLLGVSGRSSDMKTLLAWRTRDPAADQAVAMFGYHVRKAIGALAAALGGLDLLVFTGGIGERAASLRREICTGLEHLGIRLAPDAGGDELTGAGSPCRVRVVRAQENLVIARHTRDRVFGRPAGRR